MGTCPFCDATESHPIEDGWWCSSCSREYPTIAFKCPQPGCWEYAALCKEHSPPSGIATPRATNALALAQAIAKAHRNKILIWLATTFALSLLCGWLSTWAGDKEGWEGQVIQFFFGLAAAISFITLLMFCVLLYSWLSGYKSAMRDSLSLIKDRDTFLYIHRDVFGPIPWR